MNPEYMLKDYIPPVILKQTIGFFYGWSGNYSSWEKAKSKCTGYDSEIIFNKVKNALLKIKNGEAVYERDSVLFDKIYYSFPLLSSLALIAMENNGKLNVLDFGGSLGSSYFQNRKFFIHLEQFNWCIVEQPHFVKEGLANFTDNHLHFFYDIDSCLKQYQTDVLLLSSVLPYLEEPYSFLDEVMTKNLKYIIIDRTPLLSVGDDRITIQTVPGKIYNAKYPCRILNEKKILNYFSEKYDLIFETETDEKCNIKNAFFKSIFYKKRIN